MSVDASGTVAAAATQAAQAVKPPMPENRQETRTPSEVAKLAVESVEASAEKLQRAADQLNQIMQNGQRSLNFAVDKNSNQVVVTVVDKITKETIRQIPGPEAMKLAEHLEEMMGVIFNRKI